MTNPDENKETEGALISDDDWDGELDKENSADLADGRAEEAMEFLAGLVYRMGLDCRVTVRNETDEVVLDIDGRDAGRAIGKKGQTLDSLQFLTNKVLQKTGGKRRYVVVDSGDYRDRHEQHLVNMAKREAKRALDSGRPVTLEPMSPRDRRVVHLSLAKFTGVSTRSNGEGAGRRIQIIPGNAAAPSARSRPPRAQENEAAMSDGPIFVGEGPIDTDD